MKNSNIRWNILPGMAGVVGAIAGLAFAGSAVAAKSGGHQYFVLGGGGGMVMSNQPCPKIPCNTGDTCSCITASGDVSADLQKGNKSYSGKFKLEISADDSATMNNGAGGHCFASTGKFHLIFKAGTLDIPFSGLGCRIPGLPDTATFGISAPASLAVGTGFYLGKSGTGTFAGSFSPTAGTVQFDLVAFGDLS
jgi:hypothetical protein